MEKTVTTSRDIDEACYGGIMGDKSKTTPDKNALKRKKIEDALMGFLFGLCQPDKGDVFGFIDDFKSQISSHILQALEDRL